MFPNQPQAPQGPMGQPPVGSPMKPEGDGGGGQADPAAIKQQLKALMQQAKKIADANGIDFNEVVAEVSGNASRSDAPRPPSPPMGQPMMGG